MKALLKTRYLHCAEMVDEFPSQGDALEQVNRVFENLKCFREALEFTKKQKQNLELLAVPSTTGDYVFQVFAPEPQLYRVRPVMLVVFRVQEVEDGNENSQHVGP